MKTLGLVVSLFFFAAAIAAQDEVSLYLWVTGDGREESQAETDIFDALLYRKFGESERIVMVPDTGNADVLLSVVFLPMYDRSRVVGYVGFATINTRYDVEDPEREFVWELQSHTWARQTGRSTTEEIHGVADSLTQSALGWIDENMPADDE